MKNTQNSNGSMLSALSVRDIVLIENLEIEFDGGLSVLTGETGAGKSILLDGLSLALGARGDAGLVRSGADSGEVSAIFHPKSDNAAVQILADNDLSFEGEIVLRRVQMGDGRTRGYINDRPVSAQLLREVGEHLVEIHGQHDARAFLDADSHCALVDGYGSLTDQVSSLGTKWREVKSLEKELRQLESNIAKVQADQEYIAHVLEELDHLNPLDNEEQELAERRQIMMQSEKVAVDINDALEVLNGNGGVVGRLSAATRKLERRLDTAQTLLSEPVSELDSSLNQFEVALTALEEALRQCDFDPLELERTEERLFALRAAARKHKVSVSELRELRERFRNDLSQIEQGEDAINELTKKLSNARKNYLEDARKLSVARQKASEKLKQAVERELKPLKLENVEIIIHHEVLEDEPAKNGIDKLEIWVRTNKGAKAGPLKKVASGGELSRIVLALKVALAQIASAPTLIFDEVDTAVGGAVSSAIGERLARLSKEVQVLSITHAPQVAAKARQHLRISKNKATELSIEDYLPVTQVEPLVGNERREEIARMLSGATITEAARAAADQLMADL